MCAQQRSQQTSVLLVNTCHPVWYFREVRLGVYVCLHPSHQQTSPGENIVATKQKAFAQRHPQLSEWLRGHRQTEDAPAPQPAPAPQRLPQWQRQAIIAECQQRRQNTGPIPAQASARPPVRPQWLNALIESEQAQQQGLPDGPKRTATGALFLNAHVNQEDRERLERMAARVAPEKASTREVLPESDINLFDDPDDDTQVVPVVRRR